MKYPFEAEFSEIEASPESFVSAVFSSLASEFLTLPKGEGFVDYSDFETGYEALKKVTGGFATLPRSEVLKTILEVPITFVVLRSMLGFTPPEWAYVAAQRYGSELNQGFARTLDRKVRVSPTSPLRPSAEMLNPSDSDPRLHAKSLAFRRISSEESPKNGVLPEKLPANCGFSGKNAMPPIESGRFEPVADRDVSEVSKGYTPFHDADVIYAKVTSCMENGRQLCKRA